MTQSRPPIDPATDTRIEVALRAIGGILHLGEMQESVLDHMKDRLRAELGARRLADPQAPLTAEALSLAAGIVKETYGLERPRNIHDAPSPADRAAEAGEGGFFDHLGRSRFDRMVAGNTVAGFYSATSAYRGLPGATYDPARGVASLSTENFSSSPFAGSGLSPADIPFIRALAADGFTTQNIVNAARDAAALGFGPRDRERVRAFAVLDRIDPSGRADRNAAYAKYAEWLKENKDRIKALQDAVDSAPDEAARKAALAARDKFLKGGQDQTGVTAAGDRIDATPTPPGIKPGDGHDAHDTVLKGLHQKQVGAALDVGIAAHRGQDDAAAAAVRGAETGVKVEQEKTTGAQTVEAANADALASLGLDAEEVTAKPVVTGAAEKPSVVADASASPPKDGAKSAEKGEEVPADPKKKPATQVAAVKGPSVG